MIPLIRTDGVTIEVNPALVEALLPPQTLSWKLNGADI